MTGRIPLAPLVAALVIPFAAMVLPHSDTGFGHGTTDTAPSAAPSPLQLSESYALEATWDGRDFQGAPGSVLFPAGIDVTDQEVVLVDRGNHRIQSFSHDGQLRAAWGRRGSGSGELLEPNDVFAAGDTLYVADTGNGRIVGFAAGGIARSETAIAGLTRPWAVASRQGDLVVTDRDSRQAVIARDGAVVARLSGLIEPMGVDVGSDGAIYVADRAASKIAIYAPDGTARGSLATNLPPIDVAVDPLGDLYVQSAGAVLWYPNGSGASRQALYYPGMQGLAVHMRSGVFATVARTDARQGPWFHGFLRWPWQPTNDVPPVEKGLLSFPPGRLSEPHAVHAGPDGSIWVLDAWPRLQAYAADGTPTRQVVPQTAAGVAAVDMVLSPAGELLVGESRKILRVASSGAVAQEVRLTAGAEDYWLTALDWRPDIPGLSMLDSARLTVREYGVTRTLRPVGSWPLGPAVAQWQLFWDLASEPPSVGDRTYVVNRSTREIWVYRGRQRVEVWPIEGIPARVAVDAEGDLFVLTTDGLVHKLTRDGAQVALWDAGAFSAAASQVVDLAVDAAGRVYTVDLAAEVVRVWQRDQATPEPPASRPGACRLRGDKTARPSALRIGDRVTVELMIGGECPTAKPRADIVLAIDRSGSMNAGNQITDTRRAAVTFLNAIDVTRDRVAVVAFNNQAELRQPLTADRALAIAAVQGLTAVGGTNLAHALQVSTAELFGTNGRSDGQPVIVLLTDGRDREPDDALLAASSARERGTRIFTIGFGDVDPMVMVLAASSPEDHYYAPDTGRLEAIYTEIAQRITASVLARSVTVVDELPTDMRYVDSSARPAATYDAARRTLTWVLSDVPFGGQLLAFEVVPQVLGRRPTNVQAEADFVDGLGTDGHLRFPVPEVEVLSLEPTATPTSTSFPTPTPPPTRTPPPPEPLFLPVAVRQRCFDQDVFADVAVVMDTSSSMQSPSVEGGATKLDVAKAAARVFVGLLHLPGDQAALVRFDSSAGVVQELTGDSTALIRALESLASGTGTRIDLGLQLATQELVGERHNPRNNRAIVLLTDGRNTGVEDTEVVARADEAKAAGISVYTIGLGADLDAELLQRIATSQGHAFLAPTADELEDIYRQIAYTIFCPNLTWP